MSSEIHSRRIIRTPKGIFSRCSGGLYQAVAYQHLQSYLFELTQPNRSKDDWLNSVLQCNRIGNGPREVNSFSHGLPTRTCGSWLPHTNAPSCGNAVCKQPRSKWQAFWGRKHISWTDLLNREPECKVCRTERHRRCQVLEEPPTSRERLLTDFSDAPYVHPYSQLTYQAQICHAINFSRAQGRAVLWVVAQDCPLTAEEADLEPDRLTINIPSEFGK